MISPLLPSTESLVHPRTVQYAALAITSYSGSYLTPHDQGSLLRG